MSIQNKFRFFLVLSILGLIVTGILREIYGYAALAFEALNVGVTGILLVTGVYLHGYDEGRRENEKENEKTKSAMS